MKTKMPRASRNCSSASCRGDNAMDSLGNSARFRFGDKPSTGNTLAFTSGSTAQICKTERPPEDRRISTHQL
jgi:hypothetical protein